MSINIWNARIMHNWVYHICSLLPCKTYGCVYISGDHLHIVEIESVETVGGGQEDMWRNDRCATQISRTGFGCNVEAHLIWELLHEEIKVNSLFSLAVDVWQCVYCSVLTCIYPYIHTSMYSTFVRLYSH